MAGDWVKMRASLLASPKVYAIAVAIGANREASRVLTTGHSGAPGDVLSVTALRNVTVTALLVTWASANEHSRNGVLRHCDLSALDSISGIPGFGVAMEAVGWAVYDPQEMAVSLPNFKEWNSPAEDRTNAERQRRYRERRVTLRNAVTVTVEKSREEKKENTHTHTAGGEFRKPGWAADEWARFAETWNRTARARPWHQLTAPATWVEHAASPGWLARAGEAMAHLPACEFFSTPLAVTKFFEFVDRILAGEFDQERHQPGRSRQTIGGNL